MSDLGTKLVRLTIIVFMATLLWACEGDDGAAGPTGQRGPQGPQGEQGDQGDPGGTGGVPISSASKINIEVTSFSFDPMDNKPVVEFRLTNDLTQGLFGLTSLSFVLSQLSAAPLNSGESSTWQSYATREDGGVDNVQASTESSSAGTLEDLGGGDYRYKFSLALDDYPAGPTFDGSKTHRLGMEIRGQAPLANNGIFNFVPDLLPAEFDPTTAFTRSIVDNDTCNACHDVFDFHGGPRVDITYCVTCHNPSSIDADTGNTVDMAPMIHNIHVGRDDYLVIGHRDIPHDYSLVEFTQDVRNCQTCHQESDADTPEASNWRLVANRAACGSCHYDVDGAGDGDDAFAVELGEHPGGFTFVDDTQCLDCHGESANVTNSDGDLVRTADIHAIPALAASKDFVFEVVDVRNVVAGGAPLEVDYRVLDGSGVPYDLDTAPEFIACGDGTSRLAIDIGWTTDDFTNAGAGTLHAQPLGINALGAGCGGAGTDADGDGTFTATAAAGLPAGLTGSIAVALEGHPGVDLNGDGTIAGRGDRVAVTNAIAYFGIDDAATVDRRNAVLIEKCADCHNQLAIHGNNRTDKPEVCAICHNPNATDLRRRGDPTSECVTELGTDDQAIDMKNMIHGIHAGAIGVCGFGNSAHPYFNVVYPGRLNNCEGCHKPGSYYPVAPGVLLGTTIEANDPATPTDDVVISPNTSVCSSCHTGALEAEHMKQNGGDFEATKMADSSLSSSGVETCVLCHGPGSSSDVAEVHGVGEFDFN